MREQTVSFLSKYIYIYMTGVNWFNSCNEEMFKKNLECEERITRTL